MKAEVEMRVGMLLERRRITRSKHIEGYGQITCGG